MRTPHTVLPRGMKVRVTLRDGTELYGKFKERTPKHVVLFDGRKIPGGDIKAFTPVKGGKIVIRLLDIYQGTAIRPNALEFLYELMRERDPEINISHSTLPSFEQHRQFVTRRPFRLWFLIERAPVGNEPPAWLGYVSATHRNEIGIVLRRQYRGNGFGPEAVGLLTKIHKPLPAEPSERNGSWLANIAPTNAHSRHMFEKLGFTKIQETFALNEETTNGHEESPEARPA